MICISWSLNHIRIASFAHSLTTTSSPISATRTSPRSSMPITVRTASCACETGMTSRQASPASHNCVMVFSRSATVLLLSVRRAREAVERELEAIGGLHEREPHVVGGAGTVEVAGRDEQAGRVREPGGDLPAVVGAVVLAQPEVEAARAATVPESGRRERGDRERAPLLVARALHADMVVVTERGDRGGLHRDRGHEAGVLA